jgi:hypothetical protein
VRLGLYEQGYANAMNWKTENHLEHLPAKQEQPTVNQFNPDYDGVAMMYEEMKVMAKRIEELESFAKLVAAKATDEANARANASWTLMCKKMVEAEREACLNIACDYTQKFADHTYTSAVADAIRNRGQS